MQRASWIDKLGSIFESHRTLSAIVVIANTYVGYQLWQIGSPGLRRLVFATWVVLGLEMMAGTALAYFALPAFIQPIHLTLATLLFGTQFLSLLALRQLARASALPVAKVLQAVR